MSDDRSSSRPPAPTLKRFQRLEMDGDPPPAPKPAAKPRPARAAEAKHPVVATSEPADIQEARRLAAELTANARASREATSPQARRSERAEQISSRRMAPQPSAPMPRMTMEEVVISGRAAGGQSFRFEVGQPPQMTIDAAERADVARAMEYRAEPPRMRFEVPAAATPGVITMEVDIERQRWARSERAPSPIELTPMAARQVKLMAWEAGMPGSGLRILTSYTPGLGGPEIDFAFDDDVQGDDVVFLEHGVRVIVDRTSLGHLRGRRILWHDVPGAEGFLVR